MRAHRGELWWARIPNQPDDKHQPRPVLIVSEDERNQAKDDILAVPLFSGGPPGPTHIPLPAGEGGTTQESVLFCEEVTCLDVDFVSRDRRNFAGVVDDGILAEVVAGIRRAIGEDVDW